MSAHVTDQDRAEALELVSVYLGYAPGYSLSGDNVRRWLAVKEHVLASHTCPDPWQNPRVRAWHAVVGHPLFENCHQTDGSILDVLAKLDAAHDHTCVPVWRPTTRGEIQPGWEVRARRWDGAEATWGIAHHQDDDGDWRTEAEALLTYAAFDRTVETTAPLPEPEPKPDPRVDLLEGVSLRDGVVLTRSDAAMVLSIADAVERPGGER